MEVLSCIKRRTTKSVAVEADATSITFGSAAVTTNVRPGITPARTIPHLDHTSVVPSEIDTKQEYLLEPKLASTAQTNADASVADTVSIVVAVVMPYDCTGLS